MDNMEHFYKHLLSEKGFIPVDCNSPFNPSGKLWKLSEELGSGFYWVYLQDNLFNIKIHDFSFHNNTVVEFAFPECLSITWYESISADELSPCRSMNANCVRSFQGGAEPFKALIHNNVPIKSVGIELMPDYYKNYLEAKYPKVYLNPQNAFLQIDETWNFPEMVLLLKQIKNYNGGGISASLFYEAKVAEAVSLIVSRCQNPASGHLSSKDYKQIQNVAAYIAEHASYDLSLEQLSKIACMGTTKLKQTFKLANGCTITQFIQHRRVEQAKYLLAHTDGSIAQIARNVGYTNPSRFAELFRKSTGILPGEYRRLTASTLSPFS